MLVFKSCIPEIEVKKPVIMNVPTENILVEKPIFKKTVFSPPHKRFTTKIVTKKIVVLQDVTKNENTTCNTTVQPTLNIIVTTNNNVEPKNITENNKVLLEN